MKVDSMLASQMYGNAKDMLKSGAQTSEVTDNGFADALEAALREMRGSIVGGEKAAVQAMSGQGDVQSLAEALTATEMALETAVTVRDRVVEAYQEILRMPV